MKLTLYIFILTFGLLSCNNQPTEKTVDKKSVDTLQTISIENKKQDISTNDKSQYDQTFIDGLVGYGEQIKLIENYMLIGQDTAYFPEEIKLNKETIFKGTKNNNNFVLTVRRINLTSLNYNFQLLDKDAQLLNSKKGKATLGSLFFLGSESDDDDETGEGYLSVEYYDHSAGCSFAIRIGEKDDNGKLRAKIKLYCKDNKIKNIGLDENPTLRTE